MIRWFQHNWLLKLSALALATVTWLFVNGITSERDVVQAVTIEVKTKPGVMVVRQTPARVDVMVRGTHDDVRRVTRANLNVVVDLSHEEEVGEFTRELTPSMIQHPGWVRPVEVSPSRLTAILAPVKEK